MSDIHQQKKKGAEKEGSPVGNFVDTQVQQEESRNGSWQERSARTTRTTEVFGNSVNFDLSGNNVKSLADSKKQKENEKKLKKVLDETEKNMPKKLRYTSEDLARILSRQDQRLYDKSKEKEKKGYDKKLQKKREEQLEKELKEINALIAYYNDQSEENDTPYAFEDLLITKENALQLQMKQSMAFAQMLLNDTRKKDSPEMKKVKSSLVKLSAVTERYRELPPTRENIKAVMAAYDISIFQCHSYLTVKDPSSKKGKSRYEKVEKLYQMLTHEYEFIGYVLEDPESMQEKTIGTALRMEDKAVLPEEVTAWAETLRQKGEEKQRLAEKKERRMAKDKAREASAVPKEGEQALPLEQKQDSAKKLQDPDADFVYKVFSKEYRFDSLLTDPKTKDKMKRKEAGKLYSLLQTLQDWKPGKAEIREVSVLGKTVQLLKDVDDILYVVDQFEAVRLDKTPKLASEQLERTMMENAGYFEKEIVSDLIDGYEFSEKNLHKYRGDAAAQHLRIRTNLIEFLVKETGLNRDAFTNTRRNEMVEMAKKLLSGETDAAAVAHQVVESSKSEDTINGVELTELMEIDATRQAELDEHVSLYQRQVEEKRNGWTAEEMAVQRFLADCILADDTLLMDSHTSERGEYLREILLKNIDTVAYLIKEYRDDDPEQGVVEDGRIMANILRKMSLDGVKGKNDYGLSGVLQWNIRRLLKYFAKTTGADSSEEEIKTSLKGMLSDKTNEGLTKELKNANEKMEEAIEKSCGILQSNVTEIADAIFEETASDNLNDLEGIMKSAMRTSKGQGLFTKNVLNHYFSSMPVLDQRAMLAEVLRSSKKVDLKDYSTMELVQEMKKRGLVKYAGLYTEEKLETMDYTDKERALIEEYRQQKKKLQLGSNFLAGLIRGAGPLFQKMLQGLPEEAMPIEIRSAISDVKSRLMPIPERVVKSQINAMIGRSGGKVTKIDVLGSLGAASVGETFKCRLFGPDIPEEGKIVVIKLLRPDVQNRMKREEKVMLSCAELSGDAMLETYKGQLKNHYAELDLTKEAKNVEDGHFYNDHFDNVENEKVNDIIAPTVNSLVLELAEGKTLDELLRDTMEFRQKIKMELAGRKNEDGTEELYSQIQYSREKFEESRIARDKLIDKTNELIKKRDIMKNICRTWIEEAIFKSGYYHGDLHAGNIMISEDKGTFIDFGNAVRFEPKEQEAISKMITAAAAEKTDNYFEAFTELFRDENGKENFNELYDEKKQEELKAEFDRILKMGDEDKVGECIAASLIRAQQLGFKLPSSIYNFSQGQLRLQKSINDINDLIQDLHYDIDFVDSIGDKNNTFDPICIIQNKMSHAIYNSEDEFDKKAFVDRYLNLDEPVDKEEFITGLLDNQYKEADLAKGISEINKRKDFDKKFLGPLADFKNNMLLDNNFGYDIDESTKELAEEAVNDIITSMEQCVTRWDAFKAKWENSTDIPAKKEAAKDMTGKLLPDLTSGFTMDMFGGSSYLVNGLLEALTLLDFDTVDDIIDTYRTYVPLAIKVEKEVKELRELQDKGKLTDEKKENLTKSIYENYSILHEIQKKRSPIYTEVKFALYQYVRLRQVGPWLKDMFGEETVKKLTLKESTKEEKEGKVEYGAKEKTVEGALGKLLEQTYTEYVNTAEPHLDEGYNIKDDTPREVLHKLDVIRDNFMTIHGKIQELWLKKYYKGKFDREPDKKSYNFSQVMKEAVMNNKLKYITHVGGAVIKSFGKEAMNMFFGGFGSLFSWGS